MPAVKARKEESLPVPCALVPKMKMVEGAKYLITEWRIKEGSAGIKEPYTQAFVLEKIYRHIALFRSMKTGLVKCMSPFDVWKAEKEGEIERVII